MPFNPQPKNPGDLIKSDDWNQAMGAVSALYTKLDAANGHKHTGGTEDGPLIGTAGIADGAITAAKLAVGAMSQIGINVVTGISASGSTILPPTGFAVSECKFFAIISFIERTGGAGNSFNADITVNDIGRIEIIKSLNCNVAVTGIALGKRGGW